MNTAALNQLQSREDQAERDYKTFGARVVEDMVDDLLRNQPVAILRGVKINLAWILEGEGFISDFEAAKLIAADSDERNDLFLDIEKRAKAIIGEWIETSPLAAQIIEDRVRECALEAEL